nr:occludin/ELL domain-containing protein 1-like [Aegilops tauschii subsp. strangulata]
MASPPTPTASALQPPPSCSRAAPHLHGHRAPPRSLGLSCPRRPSPSRRLPFSCSYTGLTWTPRPVPRRRFPCQAPLLLAPSWPAVPLHGLLPEPPTRRASMRPRRRPPPPAVAGEQASLEDVVLARILVASPKPRRRCLRFA